MKKLSPGDKSNASRTAKDDPSLSRLLDLDGEIMEVGSGYWVAIRAKRVSASAPKPRGVAYSLALIGPKDERLVCYDNAHAVKAGRGPGGKRPIVSDHRHIRDRIEPYTYRDAETLMQDFWIDVERVLKEEGAP